MRGGENQCGGKGGRWCTDSMKEKTEASARRGRKIRRVPKVLYHFLIWKARRPDVRGGEAEEQQCEIRGLI